jgi:hypothetical protein
MKKKEDRTGLLIPAGIMIGIGVGMLTGQIPAYTMIGLGVGFLAMFLAKRK